MSSLPSGLRLCDCGTTGLIDYSLAVPSLRAARQKQARAVIRTRHARNADESAALFDQACDATLATRVKTGHAIAATPFAPLLEIRFRPFGLVATTQHWPRTRHFILRVGPVESRLILPLEQPLTLAFVATLALSLFLR